MAAEMFEQAAMKMDEHEFYTPMPAGYEKGRTKYIVVLGTVISGLGKGIFSASLGKMLQDRGLSVSPLKFDGYLNVDAGTLNPYRHGEVYVLDDGTECDMDLGNYERFLHKSLSRENYLTSGKLFSMILEKERKGLYLGRDVQFVPHVTGEIIGYLRHLGMAQRADVVIAEVGGTVGDIENSYFIEAMRQLAYEEGPGNVCFVALTYIIEPQSIGEQKSKAAQLEIKRLLGQGVQPHVVICRSHSPLDVKVREKMSISSNLPMERVVGLEDKRSIYEVPHHLRETGVDREVLSMLGLASRAKDDAAAVARWDSFVRRLEAPRHEVVVGITGKYTRMRDSYASILHSLEHAASALETRVIVKWIEATDLEKNGEIKEALSGVNGVIVPGGFGKRGTEGKIAMVRHLRERKIPFLGLCLGFQMAVIEFCRDVCGLEGAGSTEFGETPHPVIDILPEQRSLGAMGATMRLGAREMLLKEGTLARRLYNAPEVRERFRHRYEANPAYVAEMEKRGMVFSGKAKDADIMKLLELPGHPFFIGTQAHPCYRSRPLEPHPLFVGFVRACLAAKG